MASTSRSRRLPEPRSGGKIVRPRRTASAKTPYDRPVPSNSASRSPNWLSRFVFTPTRFIATGAGKLLSSVFDLEPSPTSSSSFSSSSASSGSDSGPGMPIVCSDVTISIWIVGVLGILGFKYCFCFLSFQFRNFPFLPCELEYTKLEYVKLSFL